MWEEELVQVIIELKVVNRIFKSNYQYWYLIAHEAKVMFGVNNHNQITKWPTILKDKDKLSSLINFKYIDKF